MRSAWIQRTWPCAEGLTAVVPHHLGRHPAAQDVPRPAKVAPCSAPGDPSPPELPHQTTLEIDTTQEGEKRKKCRPPSLSVPPVSPKALRFAEDDEWMLPEVSSVSVEPQGERGKTLSTPTPQLQEPLVSPSSPGLPSILARSTSNASRDSKNALRAALPSHRSMLYSRSRSRSWSAGLGRRHSDGSIFFDPSLTLTYSQSLPSPSLSLRTKIQTAESACQTDVIWKSEPKIRMQVTFPRRRAGLPRPARRGL